MDLPILRRPPPGPDSSHQVDPSCNRPRDPRFDPRVRGSSDLRHFVRNYSFLDDLKREEIAQLQKALHKEKDPERKDKIKLTVSKIKNQIVENQNKAQKVQLVDELKTSKGGGKFKNVRKSDIKKNLIVKKYKELKESGKLTKYLERKRKKLIKRDEKLLG